MSQSNQFHQVGYEHYLKAPKRPPSHPPQGESMIQPGIGGALLEKLQSPMVATGALLAAGVLFAGVIIATYPSSPSEQQPVPVIKADLRPIREVPQERGGMNIPHRDSTVLARVGQAPLSENSGEETIENLLAPSSNVENLISKEDAINNAMASSPMIPLDELESQSLQAPNAQELVSASSNAVSDQTASVQQRLVVEPKPLLPAQVSNVENNAVEGATGAVEMSANDVRQSFEKPFEVKEPAPQPQNLLQKIGSNDGQVDTLAQFEQVTAEAAQARKPSFASKVAQAQSQLATPTTSSAPVAAQQSEDTIDYVRSVLSQGGVEKIDSQGQAKALNDVESAAGVAAPVVPKAIASGTYYVQLASITDKARAATEWSKMQASYSPLGGADYRVQEANLSSGTFYRIQAGPMSKDSADKICDALKAAGKPGGCLVVK